jgi:hypothetical protein
MCVFEVLNKVFYKLGFTKLDQNLTELLIDSYFVRIVTVKIQGIYQ